MGEPFLGEIKMISFNWAPLDWALCNGQLEPITSYQALFSLLGTTFGGDARSIFGFPDLRGRVPIGTGTYTSEGYAHDFPQGRYGGFETVAINTNSMPQHTHQMNGSTENGADVAVKDSSFGVASTGVDVYGAARSLVEMNPGTLPGTGGGSGAGHANIQPTTVINFIIALEGIYPSRN